MTTQIRVVTANIKGNPLMAQPKVVHDVNRVASMADVVLWQEISNRRYKRAVEELGGWAHAHLDLEVPISWRDDLFELMHQGYVKAHDGKALASPSRYISWVILRHRVTGELVAFVNSHYVSGAWNDKRKPHKAWRKQMWLQHYDLHAEVLQALALLGVPVVGGGDFNRVKVKPFHPDMTWLSQGGIDYLFAIEYDAEIKTKSQGRCPGDFYTDHRPRRAVITIA